MGAVSGLETHLFLLILVPFAWGYLLASRVLLESQRWLRWSLAYALGLLSFLAGVNALFQIMPLRWAVYLTLALLAVGAGILLRRPSRQTDGVPFGRIEGPIISILALTAFFDALFWQMQWSDDDFFIHGPLMALALRDIFPTKNPFLLNLPLIGHYGRDLAISALSVLIGDRFLTVQYFVTAVNQAAAVLVAHGTARRYLHSPSQALWAVLFAFLGVNLDGRRGLLETFQNNNTFAFLFLFVCIYLFLTALTRRSVALTIVCGLALGTYAVIYETSYGLLAMAFAAVAVLLCALRRRWRPRYFTVTAAILILSVLVAFAQGGTLTELAKRRLPGGKVELSQSLDERRMSKELTVRIPKPGFTITSPFTAEEYPLWSWRLEEDAGTFIIALPITALLMLWWRRPWGILIACLSVIAILIPAAVDFGGVNSESLRFLVVGGVGSAMLFGVLLGMVWDAVRQSSPWVRWSVAVALGCVAAVSFWPSTRVAYQLFRDTVRYPQDHYLVAEEWGCTPVLPRRPCEPIDVSAAIALRAIVPAGNRILVDFGSESQTAIVAEATFMTLSRTAITGPGIRVLREGSYSQMTPFWEAQGFRARAFFGSGELSILDDLGASYVYLNPDNLPGEVYRRIRESPRLERVLRLEAPGGGAIREAYRVKPAATPVAWMAPKAFILISAEPPTQMEALRVYPLRLVFTGPSELSGKALRVSYDIRFPDGRVVTANDEVRHPVIPRPTGRGRWTGTLWLATPYEAGDYEVGLYGWEGTKRLALLDSAGREAVLHVRVD